MDLCEDCAGLGTVKDAALEVCTSNGVPLTAWRATESNPLLKSRLSKSGQWRKVKSDMNKVKLNDVYNNKRLKRALFYACGFQCQGFSIQGSMKGMKDSRSDTLKGAHRFVKKVLPDIVLLENVKNFTAVKFSKARAKLKTMLKKKGYKVRETILNTSDYGVPQHRERYYLVAIHRARLPCTAHEFRWPPRQPKRRLHRFIDLNFEGEVPSGYTHLRNWELVKEKIQTVWKDEKGPFVADLNTSPSFGISVRRGESMTITKNHAASKSYYIIVRDKWPREGSLRMRNLQPADLQVLQGWKRNYHFGPLEDNQKQLSAALGNAMSRNVVVAIFKTLVPLVKEDVRGLAVKESFIGKKYSLKGKGPLVMNGKTWLPVKGKKNKWILKQ
jgi:DNA (cytosine-5)-methyltransferase 1